MPAVAITDRCLHGIPPVYLSERMTVSHLAFNLMNPTLKSLSRKSELAVAISRDGHPDVETVQLNEGQPYTK
jgi:hypothetical protein